MLMRYILVNNNYINTNKVTKTYSQTDHSSSSRVENTSRDDSTSKNLDPDSKKMVLEHSQNAENLHKVNLTDNNDISSKKSSKANSTSKIEMIPNHVEINDLMSTRTVRLSPSYLESLPRGTIQRETLTNTSYGQTRKISRVMSTPKITERSRIRPNINPHTTGNGELFENLTGQPMHRHNSMNDEITSNNQRMPSNFDISRLIINNQANTKFDRKKSVSIGEIKSILKAEKQSEINQKDKDNQK